MWHASSCSILCGMCKYYVQIPNEFRIAVGIRYDAICHHPEHRGYYVGTDCIYARKYINKYTARVVDYDHMACQMYLPMENS